MSITPLLSFRFAKAGRMPTATMQAVAGARHSLAVFCPLWVYRLRR
jgi:hypothetical protein